MAGNYAKRCALMHWSFFLLNDDTRCHIWGVNNQNTATKKIYENCMRSMYVFYACILCMYSMHAFYACILCMYSTYVFRICVCKASWLSRPPGGKSLWKHHLRIQEGHFLKSALNLDLTLSDDGKCPALLKSSGIIDYGGFCVELWPFYVSKRISVSM